MPLAPCPECKSEVSDQAKACPKCGCPIRTEKPKGGGEQQGLSARAKNVILIIVAVLLIAAAVAIVIARQRAEARQNTPFSQVFVPTSIQV